MLAKGKKENSANRFLIDLGPEDVLAFVRGVECDLRSVNRTSTRLREATKVSDRRMRESVNR